MHIGMSWRALVQFFILELLLVGLLALIGQVPWWLWFVLSGLLFAALWIYDHRVELRARWRCLTPKQRTTMASSGVAAAIVVSVGVTWVLAINRQAPPPNTTPVTLEQSLLTVVGIVTEQSHDPLRITFSVINAGKLPTTKAFISIDHLIVDTPISPDQIDRRYASFRAATKKIVPQDVTLVPGRQPVLYSLHAPLVTKEVLEDVKAGKKVVYVFFAAEYRDSSIPPGKRMITELAVRSSEFTHAVAPLREWSILRNRSHLSD